MMTKVLFLCTGNSARSQMAETFVRVYGGTMFKAFSAGVQPKGINPLTVRAMKEIGFDLTGQRSKGLDEYLGKEHFDYVITLCAEADESCPRGAFGEGESLHWFFDDPAAAAGTEEEKLERFRQVRDQIQARVLAWMYEIRKKQQSTYKNVMNQV